MNGNNTYKVCSLSLFILTKTSATWQQLWLFMSIKCIYLFSLEQDLGVLQRGLEFWLRLNSVVSWNVLSWQSRCERLLKLTLHQQYSIIMITSVNIIQVLSVAAHGKDITHNIALTVTIMQIWIMYGGCKAPYFWSGNTTPQYFTCYFKKDGLQR